MEEVRQKSWFAKNWGWVLGGGCLSIIIIGVLVIGGIIYKVSAADLTIPIKGPKDEGNIIVSAEKINDEWAYKILQVKIDGEIEVINLLESNIDN